jgi:DNA-binding NtrC family response regulator
MDSGLSVLLVGDDGISLASLRDALRVHGTYSVVEARTAHEVARSLRRGVTATFVSLTFAEGIFDVVDQAFRACPSPPVIVVGRAPSPEFMFRLGRAGVGGFLPTNFEHSALDDCLREAKDLPRLWMTATVRALVGRIGLREAQCELRHMMVRHTLALCAGSRRAAAHILGVSRPAVQRVLREAEWILVDGPGNNLSGGDYPCSLVTSEAEAPSGSLGLEQRMTPRPQSPGLSKTHATIVARLGDPSRAQS